MKQPAVADANCPIVFSAGPVMKSGEAELPEEFKTNGFRIIANKKTNGSSSVFFDETSVYKNPYFTTQHEYYYPTDNSTLDFYAVYPKTQRVDYSENPSRPTITYTSDNVTDLYVASATGATASSSDVVLNFKHILSMIDVKWQAKDDMYEYHLNDLYISSVGIQTYDIASEKWLSQSLYSTKKTQYYSNVSIEGSVISQFPYIYPLSHTFIPGEIGVTATWTCCDKLTHEVVYKYTKTRKLSTDSGARYDLTVFFSGGNPDIFELDVKIKDWDEKDFMVMPSVKVLPYESLAYYDSYWKYYNRLYERVRNGVNYENIPLTPHEYVYKSIGGPDSISNLFLEVSGYSDFILYAYVDSPQDAFMISDCWESVDDMLDNDFGNYVFDPYSAEFVEVLGGRYMYGSFSLEPDVYLSQKNMLVPALYAKNYTPFEFNGLNPLKKYYIQIAFAEDLDHDPIYFANSGYFYIPGVSVIGL